MQKVTYSSLAQVNDWKTLTAHPAIYRYLLNFKEGKREQKDRIRPTFQMLCPKHDEALTSYCPKTIRIWESLITSQHFLSPKPTQLHVTGLNHKGYSIFLSSFSFSSYTHKFPISSTTARITSSVWANARSITLPTKSFNSVLSAVFLFVTLTTPPDLPKRGNKQNLGTVYVLVDFSWVLWPFKII